MKQKTSFFETTYTGKTAFIISLITGIYWVSANLFNIYTYPITGALFELLWIVLLPMLFIVPIASTIALIMEKSAKRMWYLLSILLTIGVFLWLLLK